MKNALTLRDKVFDQFLDSPRNFWDPFWSDDSVRNHLPAFKEDGETFYLSFDLPGVKKQDVKVEAHDNRVSVSAQRSSKGRSWSYEKTFELPVAINSESIQAQFEDGVLELKVPKAESVKKREIKIQ